MNRFNSFTLLFLTIFVLVCPSVNVSADVTSKTKHPGEARDSLKILDVLVNNNKIKNNPLSLQFARRALVIAKSVDSDTAMATAYKMLGIAYFPSSKDSSYFYSSLALKIAESAHLENIKIPLIYNLAMISDAAFNFKEAILLLDSSIRLAKPVNDFQGISRAYNALGNINCSIHNYDGARQMYESALSVARKETLYQQMGVALANLAKEEFEKDNNKSVALQREALSYLKKETGTEEEIARLLINVGNRYSSPDSALYYYKAALEIAVSANLTKVQFGAYNNMAYSYLDKKDIRSAESCMKDHAIPAALMEHDHDWLSSLYDTYADVCVAKSDYRTALEMQKKALKERVIDHKQKASEQLRLLVALLDVKNKELTIQNEQKELLVQKNRLQKTELWLAISMLLLVVLVFVTLILQQRNRVKFQKEQIASARRLIEMEEAEKGRTARELHDLTGQLVMGISGTVENIEFPDMRMKEQIQNRIKDLGASMRQISHRMNRAMIEYFTFIELITGLCNDFINLSGMSVQLEMSQNFPDFPNEIVLHFYRIAQELLTNAGKYASESQVKIEIKIEHGKLLLFYEDDGPGFIYRENEKTSMGIMNIFERTKLFNGQAILNTAPGKGTSWKISFPITQKTSLTLQNQI